MEFTANRKKFIEILTRINKIPQTRTTLPILSGVKIEVSASAMKLSVTNLEETFNGIYYDVAVIEQGATVLDCNSLLKLLKSLKEEIVSFYTEDLYVVVKDSFSKYILYPFLPDEFPITEFSTIGESVTINRKNFLDSLKKISFIPIIKYDSRPHIAGFLIKMTDSPLELVNTDGNMLAISSCNCERGNIEPTILYKNSIPIIDSIFGKVKSFLFEENISISKYANGICFHTGREFLYVRFIEGGYPDYSVIFPTETVMFSVNREEFVNAISAASKLYDGTKKNITFSFDGKSSLTVSYNSQSFNSFERTIQLIGSDVNKQELSFNKDYLLGVLGSIEEKTILVRMKEGNAFLFEETYTYGKFTSLIMAMRT